MIKPTKIFHMNFFVSLSCDLRKCSGIFFSPKQASTDKHTETHDKQHKYWSVKILETSGHTKRTINIFPFNESGSFLAQLQSNLKEILFKNALD